MVTEKQLNEVNSLLDALCNASFELVEVDLFSLEFRNTIEDALSLIRQQVRAEANLKGVDKFRVK